MEEFILDEFIFEPHTPPADIDCKLLKLIENKFTVGNGCWLWKNTYRHGYGRIYLNGKSRAAHRVMYELLVGPIPVGLQVNHHCDVKACVRPDHLYAGTQRENVDDLIRRGPKKLYKTYCNFGHETFEETCWKCVLSYPKADDLKLKYDSPFRDVWEQSLINSI